MHNLIFEVLNNSEFLEFRMILNHVLLDLLECIILIVINLNWNFICIIVQVNETVIKEESAIALLTIAIINLLSSLDII